MLAAQRRSRILAELSRDGTVRVTDLVELLGVSDMTVRRDLVALHRDGLLEKVHGGALAVAEPSSSEPGFAAKSVQRRREKEAIAAAAAELVHTGMAIAVSAGTTTHALTEHIARIPNLTVVTNSVWVADVLHRTGDADHLGPAHRRPPHAVRRPGGPGRGVVAAQPPRRRVLHGRARHGRAGRLQHAQPARVGDQPRDDRALAPPDRVRRLEQVGRRGLSSMAALSEAAVLVTDSGLSAHASGALADHVGELVVVDPVDDDDDDLAAAGDS